MSYFTPEKVYGTECTGGMEGSGALYQKGYDEGYNTGIAEGYDEGHADGRESGYDDGSSDGYSEGYAEGQAEGPGDLESMVERLKAFVGEGADRRTQLKDLLEFHFRGEL